MPKENKIITYMGNAFIALSFLGMVFIYYPIIRGYLFPEEILIPHGSPSIHIEKIQAHAPLLFNIDPWNKEEYLEALTRGVAHAAGTAMPGEPGTVYVFAHSSDAPWRMTRYNTIFLRLHELEAGDKIVVENNGTQYTYQVYDKKTVWPSETEYLTNTEKDQLIIQTCAPLGTDLMRLLVFAVPVSG